jgi:tRNA uridine 5-carboxymethylaminomethyl modification enzyme
VNAALSAREKEPFRLERSEAYVAVMVDDLTTKGLEEPYRLFSSRAEYRLLLGVDSAIPRLMPRALQLGLVTADDYSRAMRSEERVRNADSRLGAWDVRPDRSTREKLEKATGIRLEEPTTLRNLLKRNDLTPDALSRYAPEPFAGLSSEELAILESRIRYEGYIRRESEKLERLRPLEERRIPDGLEYRDIPGLSREVVEKCSRRRPRTVGDAGRIPGVTPAAVAIICAHAIRDRAGRTSSP